MSQGWNSFIFDAGRLFSAFVSGLMFVSVFLSLLLILGIFYVNFRLGHMTKLKEAKERAGGSASMRSTHFSMADVAGVHNLPGAVVAEPQENPRWKEIEQHMESSNQSDWRLAILEADIMLYDMLDQMGYQGDSIGEKLKQVEPASFTTLDDAWRAHKVRNTIAHEGSSYEMSRSEADRTISLYKKVFHEFYYV